MWDFTPVPWVVIKLKLCGRKHTLSGDMAELDANVADNLRANREIVHGLTEVGGAGK